MYHHLPLTMTRRGYVGFDMVSVMAYMLSIFIYYIYIYIFIYIFTFKG